jgi:hypothetical protein
MILQIDGWFGAGKSVLWTLLDDHPEIFCSPIHDYAYAAFLNQTNELDWIKTKHIEILRKALARTQYYKFEKVFWDGFISFEFSSKDVLELPYSLDYYKHDKKFIEAIMAESEWNIELITEHLYKSIFKTAKPDTKITPSYYASMSNSLFSEHYKNMPLLFPNGKSIQVSRSIEKIIATRSNRKPRKGDFKTWSFFSDSFKKRMQEGEVEKICSFYREYDRLVELFPDYFHVVDFLDLVNKTEETMSKVANFLNIKKDPILFKATYQGVELIHDGKKYIGQENDNIDELLTPGEREIIQNRINTFNKSIV